MVNGFFGKHGAHICPAGRVADHTCAASQQGNGLVPCHLQAFHQAQGHKMPHVEGVGGGVKANIKYSFAVVYGFPDLLFVGHLGNKAPGF